MLLTLVAIVTASAGETLGRSGSTFEFRPGVIVDPERSAVYLMHTERGIDAVDLSSGKVLWWTDQAAKPLLRHDDWLVAQTQPSVGQQFLRIAFLNSHDIAADSRYVDIPLTAGVQVTIDDAMESSFSAAARVHEGILVLSWQYIYRRMTPSLRPFCCIIRAPMTSTWGSGTSRATPPSSASTRATAASWAPSPSRSHYPARLGRRRSIMARRT